MGFNYRIFKGHNYGQTLDIGFINIILCVYKFVLRKLCVMCYNIIIILTL